MQRRAFLGLCGVGVAALLRSPAEVLATPAPGGIKVGLTSTIFPGMSDAMLTAAAKPFRSLLEQATGVSGAIVQGGNAQSLGAKLKKDEVQLGVFQGIEFAWAKQENAGLEPLVICVNQKRILKAYLIVRANSGVSKVADLKNKTLIYPADVREHCKAFLRARGVTEGATVRSFYKNLVKAGDTEEALDELCDGNATAALVDGLAWLGYKAGKPGCASRLRILEMSEAFPCSMVACQSGRFNDGQVRRFRSGLVEARNSRKGKQMMEFLRITGFEEVPDYYGKMIVSVAKTYPVPAK